MALVQWNKNLGQRAYPFNPLTIDVKTFVFIIITLMIYRRLENFRQSRLTMKVKARKYFRQPINGVSLYSLNSHSDKN